MAGVIYRYMSGRPIDGSPGRYLRPGMDRLPGWQRQAWRLTLPVAVVHLARHWGDPGTRLFAVALAAVVLWQVHKFLLRRRFRAEYIDPTLAAIAPAVGHKTGAGVSLYVDPTLGNLTPRLAKPPSPAEQWARQVYGSSVEPVLRWLPDRAQRAAWRVQVWARPVTSKAVLLRRPGETLGPRIDLTVESPYLAAEQRQLVSSIISSKIPVSDLVETWNQVGATVRARWTVRKRPPVNVGREQVMEHAGRLKEWEYYVGQSAGGRPVVISLREDSPHIAVSAGSGAGKSVLAQLIAVQVLRRGGRVIILDRKGSHRWAIGLPRVDYCTKAAQMHQALIREAAEADELNDMALHEADDWAPEVRTFIICEELNATIGQLANYWAEVREKSDPKKSPAINALAELLFMGRSVKKNVLAVAQMLTARAIGGPEARENFGIRFLARYTVNAWKMLVPEAAMPRSSRTLGRWQVVIGGVATEVQVAYLTTKQARALADPQEALDGPLSSVVTDNGNKMTLREAAESGLIPWSYSAAKMRLARKVGKVPSPQGTKGKAFLYYVADLERWAAGWEVPEEVS